MPLPIEIDAFYRKWEHRWQKDHDKSFLEKKFIEDVFCFAVPIGELVNLEPQFHFKDDNGGNRYIDFVFHVNGRKLAIELDGITKLKRVDGSIDRQRFNDLLSRQNSLLPQVDSLVRFSFDHLEHHTRKTRQIFIDSVKLLQDNSLTPSEIAERMRIDNETFKNEILQILNKEAKNEEIKDLIKELKEQSAHVSNQPPPPPPQVTIKQMIIGFALLALIITVVFFWKNRSTTALPVERIQIPTSQSVNIGFQVLSGAFISDNRFVVSTGNLLREMSTDWSISTIQQQKTLQSAEAILSCTADYVTGCQYAGLNTGYLHSCTDSLQLAPVKNHIIAMALPESMNKLLISIKHSGVFTLDKSTLKVLDTVYTQSEINAIDFLPESQQYVLGDKDGYVIFLSLSREVIRKVKVSSEPIRSLCRGRSSAEVFVGDNNGNLFTVTDAPQKMFDPFNGSIIALRLSGSNTIEVLCQSGQIYRKEF